jgi:hypothetical protein
MNPKLVCFSKYCPTGTIFRSSSSTSTQILITPPHVADFSSCGAPCPFSGLANALASQSFHSVVDCHFSPSIISESWEVKRTKVTSANCISVERRHEVSGELQKYLLPLTIDPPRLFH